MTSPNKIAINVDIGMLLLGRDKSKERFGKEMNKFKI